MKKILLTTTMLVGFAVAANATEAGKMYVRGDLGYQFSGSKNEALDSNKSGKRLTGFVGDIGFGYAIADNMRTDLTVNFSNPSGNQKVEKLGANITKVDGVAVAKAEKALVDANAMTADSTDKNAPTPKANAITAANAAITAATITLDGDKAITSKMKNRNIGLMANVYYDFTTGSAFTPYVMGGVGLSRSNQQLTISGTKTSSTDAASFVLKSANKTGFAYAIGAGVGYEMSKDVVLDVGYKLTGRPSSKYTHKFADDSSYTVVAGSKTDTYNKANPYKSKAPSVAHAFTAGVRFAF